MMQDLKFALRQLFKNPGFTAVAVLTLALGIGANTAIFTIINALILRSLPVFHPEQLIQVCSGRDNLNNRHFSYPEYELFRDGTRRLTGLFTVGSIGASDRFVGPSNSSADAEFVRGQPVSGNFFSVLGTPPWLGRTLTPADDEKGRAESVLVLSYNFWQRRFAGDPSMIGKSVVFKDTPFTIAGVMPPGFFGVQPGENPDLWWPLQMTPQVDRDPSTEKLSANTSWLLVMGRRDPATSLSTVQAELGVIFQQFLEQRAAARGDRWTTRERQSYLDQRVGVESAAAGWTWHREQHRKPLLILMGTVAAVLLIACANVASLLLARASARQREFSIRSAIGASRLRLVRQLLTESLLLSACGGLLGLVLAQLGSGALRAVMQLEADPLSLRLSPDLTVLLFTTGTALVTAIVFGLVPALRGSRIDLVSALKGLAGIPSRQRLNQALVISQVALAIVLLVGAGLFVRTLRNLKRTDMGFARENVVHLRIDLASRLESPRRAAFIKEFLARLEPMPGVRAASLYQHGMLGGSTWGTKIVAEGSGPSDASSPSCSGMWVGPKIVETLGMTLVAGRDFGRQDERPFEATNTAPRAAIINQTMANQLFAEVNPLGKRFHFPATPEIKMEIIGVVKDAKYSSLRWDSPSTFYLPYVQDADVKGLTFVVRTIQDKAALAGNLAAVLKDTHPAARLRDVRTMEEVVDASVHEERTVAQLGGFFSLFALMLACLGIYGVLSFTVVQRTREIGVRVALGARKWDVLSLIVGKGVKLALAGCVVGLVAGAGASRLIASQLFGVTPHDPVTLVGVTLLLLLVAVAASGLPAWRASRVDPMHALRHE
jgi:predicted permease